MVFVNRDPAISIIDAGAEPATLLDLLEQQAQATGARQAFGFLVDGEGHEERLAFAALAARARQIAGLLQAEGVRPGERVLLLYPPGLEYICAFYGCIYAGAVAVPLYPPDPGRARRSSPRIHAVVGDCQPRAVLTSAALLGSDELAQLGSALFAGVQLLASDAATAAGAGGDWRRPARDQDDLALLQYTSGSTSTPRGVMLSHHNMLANAAIQRRAWRTGPASRGVSWLPLYHGLGVISCLVQTVYAAFPTVMMAPALFLQRPMRWLEAMSRQRGTFGGGPNFAYDLCARKSTAAERAALDLSTWECAINGAEPVRAETIERFVAAFAPSGFRRAAMYPCYGM